MIPEIDLWPPYTRGHTHVPTSAHTKGVLEFTVLDIYYSLLLMAVLLKIFLCMDPGDYIHVFPSGVMGLEA